MHPHSRTPAYNGHMPVRRQGSRIPWANKFSIRCGAPEPQGTEVLANAQIPPNEERTSKIHRICKLLQKLYSPIIREDRPVPRTDKPAKIDQELISNFEAINRSFDNACGLWLKQPLPNRQYVLMTDANFKNAGYALMTEEDPEQKITSTKKTYAPVAFGYKTFSPSQ